MKKYQYRIRAHHLMCLAFFEGKGYSNRFTEHMSEVKNSLKGNPMVCITNETDIICSVCPNNIKGICTSADKVAEYDRQVLIRCNLACNEVMRFSELERLVYDNILFKEKREEICGNCQWNLLCHFKNQPERGRMEEV